MNSEQQPDTGPNVVLVGYGPDGGRREFPAAGEEALAVGEDLRKKGGRILGMRRLGPGATPRGVSSLDFARFNERLAASVRLGVPLPDGVRAMAVAARAKRFQHALGKVADALERGETLEDAFETEGAQFPELYVRLLQSGERAGSLPDTLLAVARNVRADREFRKSVAEALVYPVVLLVAAAVVLGGFAAHVLPIYEMAGLVPTALTDWLTLSAPGARLAAALAIGLVAIGAGWWASLSRSWGGRKRKEAILRGAPVVGAVYEAGIWSAVADILARLFDNGVPAPEALRLAGHATMSPWVAEAMDATADAADQGASLGEAAASSSAPWRVRQAVGLAEAGGGLGEEMTRLAEDYRRMAQSKCRSVLRKLPVVLTLLLGVFVLLVALGTIGPFFQIAHLPGVP